ncbi:MAG: efflux RND transporter periplasmic adaptor subunit [Bacteroidales bacterium]|nr:efflux RND transporter periplasmic adaptor subunit [Bacteroidales bacterium]
MKKILFVLLVGILTACSSKVDNPGSTDEIQNQISEYKKQVIELNKKINELEKDLQSSTDEPVQGTPVAIKELAFEEFNHYIEVNGVVEAINAAYISPEINGQVKQIYVKEGQHVKKGQLLLKINSSITESSIKEVETSLELANTVYEKQTQLWEKNIGSELDYLQAKNNKEALESRLETLQAQNDMAMIKAPIDGIIDEVLVKEGELAIPGMQMIQLVNLNDLFVNADVSEAYITKVRKGEMVVLEFPSYPDIVMEVPVHRTGNVVKSANRTFKVQLKIKNINDQIKPNVLARIKINDYTSENALLVTSIIVKQDLKGSYVFVANGDNTAKKVYIETGMSYMDLTMVTTGLSVGDRVIVNGYNQVSNGSKLEIVD